MASTESLIEVDLVAVIDVARVRGVAEGRVRMSLLVRETGE